MLQRIRLIAIPILIVAGAACKPSQEEEAAQKRIREEAVIRADPTMMRLAISHAVCLSGDLETEALADIEKEKGHIAGADPANVLELQKKVAEQRKLRSRLLALLGTVEPLACASKDLEPLRRCVAHGAGIWFDEPSKSKLPPECSSPADRALARLPAALLAEEQGKLLDGH